MAYLHSPTSDSVHEAISMNLPKHNFRLKALAQVFCGIVFLLCLGMMLTWIFGGAGAKPIVARMMKFNTALSLIFASVSLYYSNLHPGNAKRFFFPQLMASFVILIGGMTFFEYIFGIDLGIDELFIMDTRNDESVLFPGRMAPNAAFCLLVLGLALLLIDGADGFRKLAQRLATLSGMVAFFALIGYLFEAQGLYQISNYIRISPYTAVCVWLLSTGVLFARPQYGMVKILLSQNPSGLFARRMLLAAIILPPILGWLGMMAEYMGYMTSVTSSALVATLTIVLFMSLVWYSADAMSSSETALNESEVQFRTLANSIPQLAWMADKDGWIFWYNQRWFEYTGMTLQEGEGWGWTRAVHEDHVQKVVGSVIESIKIGAPWEHTFPVRSKEGHWNWFLSRALPVRNSKNEITFWFGTNTDVTEKIRIEQELKENKEAAEKANQAKTQFLANMSHEIRTPIGAIMGFTELLKSSKSDSDKLNFMAIIERNSQQLLRLIDDILDLSKVEAGKIALEKINFVFTDFLADIGSVMALRAAEKGISFIMRLDGLVPEKICTDQLRLRQILSNIAGNAIKFTEAGKVELIVKNDNSKLIFTVTDTGPGISPENSQKLFQSFTQADPSMTRKFGGTGLGLVLSKKLSQILGGDLVLKESHLGKGSTFVTTIQYQEVKDAKMVGKESLTILESSEITHAEEKRKLAGLRVLVVEDSADNRMLVTTYLKKTGAHVDIANDGVEGYDQAMKLMPDVILMDIQMPRLDGHATTKQLRQAGFTKPIIALTAHAMREERDKCFESGCTDYLTKPIHREKLIDVLNRYNPSKNNQEHL